MHPAQQSLNCRAPCFRPVMSRSCCSQRTSSSHPLPQAKLIFNAALTGCDLFAGTRCARRSTAPEHFYTLDWEQKQIDTDVCVFSLQENEQMCVVLGSRLPLKARKIMLRVVFQLFILETLFHVLIIPRKTAWEFNYLPVCADEIQKLWRI